MIEVLIGAMMSIIVAAQNENATIEQKQHALETAEIVINFLAKEQDKIVASINQCSATNPTIIVPKQTTNTQTPTNNDPQLGAVEQDQSDLIVKFTGKNKVDAVNNMPFGGFSFRVHVKDSEGNYVKNAPISVEYPNDAVYSRNENLTPEEDKATNGNLHKKTNGQSGPRTGDWSASFEYVPSEEGYETKTIRFTSGDMTKEFTVQQLINQ